MIKYINLQYKKPKPTKDKPIEIKETIMQHPPNISGEEDLGNQH